MSFENVGKDLKISLHEFQLQCKCLNKRMAKRNKTKRKGQDSDSQGCMKKWAEARQELWEPLRLETARKGSVLKSVGMGGGCPLT